MTFQIACRLDELPEPGGVLGVEVEGEPVCIVRDATGEIHAVNDVCSHQYVKFSDGEDCVDDCQIECWLHAARFSLTTGAPSGLPAIDPIDVYPVTESGDHLLVDVASPTNRS